MWPSLPSMPRLGSRRGVQSPVRKRSSASSTSSGARRGEGAEAAAGDAEDGLVRRGRHAQGGERGAVAAERDDDVAVGRLRRGRHLAVLPRGPHLRDLDAVGGGPVAHGGERAVDRPAGVHDEADALHGGAR